MKSYIIEISSNDNHVALYKKNNKFYVENQANRQGARISRVICSEKTAVRLQGTKKEDQFDALMQFWCDNI